jgi:hypothetical protein
MHQFARPAATLAAASITLSLATPALAQFAEPDAVALHTITGEGGNFAWAASELADIDGDGAGDLITGAPGFDTTVGVNTGRLYVYSGATAALLYTFDGPAANTSLGYSMADAGDTNADTVHDILAGGQGSQGGTSPGNAYLYSGADGTILLSLTGEQIAENFGHAVTGIGDIDADGRDDLLVGAPNYDGVVGANTGRAYVFSGADGSPIRVHEGPAAGDLLGNGVSGVGDVNGDAVPDYAVSATRGGPDNKGACFVYSGADGSVIHELLADPTGSQFGQFFVGGPGDFNRDGTPDIYVGDYADSSAYVFSGLDGTKIFDYDGIPGEGLGCGRGAGDVNGDGHADLAVGAYTHNDGNGTGRIYLFSGCDGSILRTITNNQGTNEQLGFDAVGMADTNADDIPEIIGASGNGNKLYIIRGNYHPIPDMNHDGVINTQDVLAFLNAWTAGDPAADFNADGAIDTRDVLVFLNRWNAGC